MLSRRRLKNLSPIQNTLKFFTPMSNCHSRRFVWIYLLRIIKEKAQAMTKQKNKNLGSHLAQVVVGAGLAIGGGAVGASAHTTHSPMNPAAVNPAAIAKPGVQTPGTMQLASCNACGAKKTACNPCGKATKACGACGACNPCAAKKGCSPCNPAAVKNPCGSSKPACNPCQR